MRRVTVFVVLAVAVAGLVLIVGRPRTDAPGRAGEAVEDAGDAIEDAADDAGDAVKDAGEDVEDAARDIGEDRNPG